MNRKALIIGSPDEKISGPKVDILNYRNFFLSPLGGAWEAGELVCLESPTKQQVDKHLLALKSADYSVVVFAGHGRHVSANSPPKILLQSDVEISSADLTVGAPKHTLILDCCRVHEVEVIADSVLAKSEMLKRSLSTNQCRKYFDIWLDNCNPGIVVLYACGFNELANESSAQGGWYSSALMSVCKDWERESSINTSTDYSVLSVVGAHDRAKSLVERFSGNRQTPERANPRTAPYFPFAVIA